MAESLILPSEKSPSFFNKDALLWGLLASNVIPFFGPVAATSIGVGSMMVGGWLGHSRMEEEAREGKAVKEPSFFNKSALIGGGIGGWLGWAGGIAAAAITYGVPALSAALAPGASVAIATGTLMTFAPAVVASLTVVAAGLAIGTIAGLLIGGFSGKAKMAEEYQAAEQYQSQRSQSPQQELSLSKKKELGLPLPEFDNHLATNNSKADAVAQNRAITPQTSKAVG